MNRASRLSVAVLAAGMGSAAAVQAWAYPEFEPRGRLHLDAGFHSEDDVEMDDNFLARRTRLGVGGSLDPDWDFRIEYDFAEEGVSANDVRLRRDLAGGRLWIGQFKVPMGLNELTSSNNITFIERASNSNVVADSRRIGVAYHNFSGPLGYQLMTYGRSLGGGGTDGDMQLGFAGRLVFNPVKTDTQVLHLGLSAAQEDRGDQNSVSFSDRPEARPAGVRLINTGTLEDVDSTTKLGLEAAWRSGPISLEAEYLQAQVDRDDSDDPTFGGWHVQGSYVLTGESRSYGSGGFGGISPEAPTGAWEVAARYSSTDLEDEGIEGGKQNNLTLGLNWYATSNVRFMANYIMVDVEDANAQIGEDDNGDPVFGPGDDSPNIFLLRAQYNF